MKAIQARAVTATPRPNWVSPKEPSAFWVRARAARPLLTAFSSSGVISFSAGLLAAEASVPTEEDGAAAFGSGWAVVTRREVVKGRRAWVSNSMAGGVGPARAAPASEHARDVAGWGACFIMVFRRGRGPGSRGLGRGRLEQ